MQISQLNNQLENQEGLPPKTYYDPYLDPEQEALLKLEEEEKANKFITTDFRTEFSEEAQAMLDAIAWANASGEGIIDIPSSRFIPKFVERFGEQTFNGALGLLALGEKIYGLGVGGTADVLVGLGMNESSAGRLARDLMALPETLPPTVSNSLASYRKLNQEVITNFARDNKVNLNTELLNNKLKNQIKNTLIDGGNFVVSEIEDFLTSLGFSNKIDNDFATVNIGGNISKNKGSANNSNNTNNIMTQPNYSILYDTKFDEKQGTGVHSQAYAESIKNSKNPYRGSTDALKDATTMFNDFIENNLTTRDLVSGLPVTITNLPKDFPKLNSHDQRKLLDFLRNLNKNTGWFPTTNNIMATEIPDNLAKFNSENLIKTGFKVKNVNFIEKFLGPIFGTSGIELPNYSKYLVKGKLPKNYRQLTDEVIEREKSTIKLSDVLTHDLLFDIHPELKNLRVRLLTPREILDPDYSQVRGYFQSKEKLDSSSPNYDPNLDNEYSVIAFHPNLFIKRKKDQLYFKGRNYNEDIMGVILHETQHAIQARSGVSSSFESLLNTYKKNVVLQSESTYNKITNLSNNDPNSLKDAVALYKGNYATKDYDIVFYTKKDFDLMMKNVKKMYPSLSYSKRKEKAEEMFLQKFLPNKADVSPSEYQELKNSFRQISVDHAKHLSAIQYYTFRSQLGGSRSMSVIQDLGDPIKIGASSFPKFIKTFSKELDEKDIDNFLNYFAKMNEAESRATQNRFKLSAEDRSKYFIYDNLLAPASGRSLSMADVIIKSAEVNQNVTKIDQIMLDLANKLRLSIKNDLKTTNVKLSDDELNYFVSNLMYQRFDPTFLAGELKHSSNIIFKGQTLFDGLEEVGFKNTANFIKDNIQTKIYDDIAYRYFGLQGDWRKTSTNQTINKVRKSFNSAYYKPNKDLSLAEISEITPKPGSKFSSTMPKNLMTNELNIFSKFKPR